MKHKMLASLIISAMFTGCLSGCGADNIAETSVPEAEQTSVSTEVSVPVEITAETKKSEKEKITETEAETAVTEEVPEITDYNELYKSALDEFYDYICNHDQYDDIPDKGGMKGVFEVVNGLSASSGLALLGYSVTDISGDGIPELLIGDIVDRKNDIAMGNRILAVYNCADGKPECTFEGWARSRHSYSGNGSFYYSGSTGAMYSQVGKAVISEDGTELEWSDFYFTDYKDDSEQETGIFYNKEGYYGKEKSELLDITDEEFGMIQNQLMEDITNIELIPFLKYKEVEEESAVMVDWAENVLESYWDYDEYIDDDSEYSTKVVFFTESKVKQFKILALTFEDVDDDGNISFSSEELYSQNELNSDKAFLLGLKFEGTIPSYGISYVDKNGTTKQYSVSISGRDGSVILTEF